MRKKFFDFLIIGLAVVFIMSIGGKYLVSKPQDILLGDTKIIPGDTNGDNKINTTDYILIRKHILGTKSLTGDSLTRADISGDKKLTLVDYITIRKVVLGLISTPTAITTHEEKYTVVYSANYSGGTISPASKTLTAGSEIGSLPIPTRSGYTFIGWFTKSNSTCDYTYYANTYDDLKRSFGYNESSLRAHWLNNGRGEGRMCSSDSVIPSMKVNSNMTIYAIWEAQATTTVKYTVTYDLNYSGSTPSSKTVSKGSEIGSLPTPERSGYKFIGWFTNSSSTCDYKYYSNSNTDLKNTYGYDEVGLQEHWFSHGRSEGRKCSSDNVTTDMKVNSNITIYAAWLKLSSKIHYLKTGEADAILLESNGRYGLMDAARPGNKEVSAYLNKLGVKKLDFIIISHSDMDHIGGVPTLSSYINEYTKYYYRAVYQSSNKENYDNAINTVNNAKGKLVEVTKQAPVFYLGDFKIELMNTSPATSDEKKVGAAANAPAVNDNKESIVAYVTYNDGHGTLLTGDMESQDEYRMISKINDRKLNIEVLKVAHHSWQSSTTMKFTKAIKPKIAVITNNNVLDDISTPLYYMQQQYGTKFYLSEKTDGAVVIDYSNNLAVSPSKSLVETYQVKKTIGNWNMLQNGIWFYTKEKGKLSTVLYDQWITIDGKWYYLGLQGNMMTGFVETKYKVSSTETKVGVYYLNSKGEMQTGWQQPIEIGPYSTDKTSYQQCVYSHENYLIYGWYEYFGTWADGKKWFYFDPQSGMVHNTTIKINGVDYKFNADGVCISSGC